jgi:protein-S-isoprenylcysteine O-methyltransferase Ste14
LATLPVVITAVRLRARDPSRFAAPVSGRLGRAALGAVLACGVLAWAWSAALILTRVPRHRLITDGPYAVMKHPLYTSVGLLVLPAAGLLRHTWLGAVVGLALYANARRFAPDEERELAATFGPEWERYRRTVLLPWL